jgi:hypothetical protein
MASAANSASGKGSIVNHIGVVDYSHPDFLKQNSTESSFNAILRVIKESINLSGKSNFNKNREIKEQKSSNLDTASNVFNSYMPILGFNCFSIDL